MSHSNVDAVSGLPVQPLPCQAFKRVGNIFLRQFKFISLSEALGLLALSGAKKAR